MYGSQYLYLRKGKNKADKIVCNQYGLVAKQETDHDLTKRSVSE